MVSFGRSRVRAPHGAPARPRNPGPPMTITCKSRIINCPLARCAACGSPAVSTAQHPDCPRSLSRHRRRGRGATKGEDNTPPREREEAQSAGCSQVDFAFLL
ncbi:unnamed protein product [Trichogramma brassicae]|uniref:Uncharacterized protein n=1 Tax=Trichogramma brassicae TaxID=86971 RepID=A0A6H5HYQ1_9HYME|nr:unnamed protein product [Trichogramma brassicae]